jgi:acyl carrier protein
MEDLQGIAREVIGDRDIVLTRDMTAADVPGWDSLNHTLVSVEISAFVGREVEAQELAQAANFGALVDHVNRAS